MASLDGMPQAQPQAPPIDWLPICRRIVEGQRGVLSAQPGIAARSQYEGTGAGGDHSLVIDRRCEDEVFTELDELVGAGHSLLAVSEERGEIALGDGEAEIRVVIDPIDGSLNARRTIPSYALSLAVASGPSMADVEFGYVYDFGTGEEFEASRGDGARLNGEQLRSSDGKQGVEGIRDLEIVGLEAADPSLVLPIVQRLEDKAYRLRAVGSIAISLCYVAAGRFDGLIAARPCRSVDAAAAQLIVRESGGDVEFAGLSLDEADLGLEARYALVGARDPEQLGVLLEAQGPLP